MKSSLRLLVRTIAGCLLVLGSAAAQTPDEYAYFSTRLAKISEELHLTSQQQAKVKPLLEQETALMEQVYNNPVLSRKDKLERYWTILNESEAKMKPMLSPDQLAALSDFQEQQKQRYNELREEAKKKD